VLWNWISLHRTISSVICSCQKLLTSYSLFICAYINIYIHAERSQFFYWTETILERQKSKVFCCNLIHCSVWWRNFQCCDNERDLYVLMPKYSSYNILDISTPGQHCNFCKDTTFAFVCFGFFKPSRDFVYLFLFLVFGYFFYLASVVKHFL